MTESKQNVKMVRGDRKTFGFDVTGTADITGLTIKWRAARSVNSSTVVISKDNGSVGGVRQVNAQRFEVDLEPTDTETLRGDYYHEAEFTDGSGNPSTVARGTLTIEPDLIR